MKIFRNELEICEIKDYKQVGRFMEVAYIECTIESPTPIDFKIGDRVIFDYNNQPYTIYDTPSIKKQARAKTYGKAFVYELKFKADTEQLAICPFLDLVLNDNGVHYSSLPSFSTFENVYGIAARIQANLDYLFPGNWSIRVADTVDTEHKESLLEAKEFSISGESCLDGLKKIYNTWGVSFIHTVEGSKNIITIGKSAGTTGLFQYGINQGLRTIKKSIQNQEQLCTRLYAFGSTRNVPARWYNDKGYIGESQFAPNLMLPPSIWAGGSPKGAYIDAIFDKKEGDVVFPNADNRIEKYGLHIKTFVYDGSEGREEIYPSINKLTAKNIRDAKLAIGDVNNIPSDFYYPDSERMDYILSGSDITDNGTTTEDGYELYSEKYEVEVPELNEKINIAPQGYDGSGVIPVIEHDFYICSFEIIKAAKYKIAAREAFVRTLKNDVKSNVHLEILIKKPNGKFIKIQTSKNIKDKLFDTLDLPEFVFSANIKGEYNIVARATVDWNDVDGIVGTVNPDEGFYFSCVTYVDETFAYSRGENIITSQFSIGIKQIGFNLNDVTASDNSKKTIHFLTGMCSGRTFEIDKCEYIESNDSWNLTCRRVDDSGVSQRFPNSVFPINTGDQFVLLNINMPDLYIYTAMQRLHDAALRDLEYYSKPQYAIEPEIDNILMLRSPQVLREGMYMPIFDADVSLKDNILIDSVTITNKGKESRKFDVTLRNDKIYNRFNKIANQLADLESSNQLTSQQSLRKPAADNPEDVILTTTDERIALFESIFGVDVNGDVYVKMKDIDTPRNFYSFGEVSSGGVGSGNSGGGGSEGGGSGSGIDVLPLSQLGTDIGSEDLSKTFSAYAINSIYNDVKTLIGGGGNYLTKELADTYYAPLSAFNTLSTNFNALNTKITDFFSNEEDVDTTINRWKELEKFLQDYTETSTLADLLAGKADKLGVDNLANQVALNMTNIETLTNTINSIEPIVVSNVERIGVLESKVGENELNIQTNHEQILDLIDKYNIVDSKFEHLQKRIEVIESWFTLVDSDEDGVDDTLLCAQYNIASYGEVSSGGIGSGSSGGGGGGSGVGNILPSTSLAAYGSTEKLTEVFSAYTTKLISDRVGVLEERNPINLSSMWGALASSGSEKIDVSHIPDLSGVYLPKTGGTINSKSYLGLVLNSPDIALNQLQLRINDEIKGIYQYNATIGVGFSYEGKGGIYVSLGGLPIFVSSSLDKYILYHSGNFNPANYLLLTGGTISNSVYGKALTIHRSDSNYDSVIKFSNVSDGLLGYIGISGSATTQAPKAPYYSPDGNVLYPLIHSGNIGNQSVNYASNAGNADTLNGFDSDTFVKTYSSSADNLTRFTNRAFFQTSWIIGQGDFCSLVIPTWIGNNTETYYTTELRFNNTSTNPNIRVTRPNGTSDWYTLARTIDNVASATKLQDNTAYTAWGQIFFQNGVPKNVSGSLIGVDFLKFDSTNTYGILKGSAFSSSFTESDLVYSAQNHRFYNGNSYAFTIKNNGNILIGDIYDTGAKLQVNGSLAVKNGHISIPNSYHYYVTDSAGTKRHVITLNANNNLMIGNGTAEAGYSTYLYGSTIVFKKNTATELARLDENGLDLSAISTQSITIGGATLTWDAESECLIVDKNLAAYGEVSSGGIGDGSASGGNVNLLQSWSGEWDSSYALSAGLGVDLNNRLVALEANGGINLTSMWSALATDDSSKVIHSSHIPDLRDTYLYMPLHRLSSSIDLNTLLTGGGKVYNYGSPAYWQNAPDMSYGSVFQFNSYENNSDHLAVQLAFDINHSSTTTTRGFWYRTRGNVSWANANWKRVLDDSNYGNYALPLSGGTINSNTYETSLLLSTSTNPQQAGLVRNANTGGYGLYLWNASGGRLGLLEDGTPHYNQNTLIHSGNIGSQSVASAQNLTHSNGTIGATVSSSGNILIGATTDNGAKLQVNGSYSLFYKDFRLITDSTGSPSLIYEGTSNWAKGFKFLHKGSTQMVQFGAYGEVANNIVDMAFISVGSQTFSSAIIRVYEDRAVISGNISVANTSTLANSLIVNKGSGNARLFVNKVTANIDYAHIYVSNAAGTDKHRPLVLQNGYGNVLIGTDTASGNALLQVSGGLSATTGSFSSTLSVSGKTILNNVDINANYELVCNGTASFTTIKPISANTYDLGTDFFRWNNAYINTLDLSGNISVGGTLSVAKTTTLSGTLSVSQLASFRNVEVGSGYSLNCFGNGYFTHIYPQANNTYNLGSSSAQWNNLFAQNINCATGELNISAAGVINFTNTKALSSSTPTIYAPVITSFYLLAPNGGQIGMSNVRWENVYSKYGDFENSIYIGSARVWWDSENDCLRVSKNFASDGEVSSGGVNSNSSNSESSNAPILGGTISGDLDVTGKVTIGGLTTMNSGFLSKSIQVGSMNNDSIGFGNCSIDLYGSLFLNNPTTGKWASFTISDTSEMVVINRALSVISLTQTSDIRFKQVIEDVYLSSEIIANAPMFRFTWADNQDGKVHIGTSAQYWMSYAPELTAFVDNKYTLDYATLGVLMGKSNATEIERLKAEVRELRLKVESYERMLNAN